MEYWNRKQGKVWLAWLSRTGIELGSYSGNLDAPLLELKSLLVILLLTVEPTLG